MDEHLTVTQTAAHLGYCERHIRRLIERGELRAFTAGRGRRLMIPVSEVENFLRPAFVVRAEATAAYYAAREVIDTILRNRDHLPAGLVERAEVAKRSFVEGES